MDGGVLQGGSDLREVQIVFPDHLLALLKLDSADVFSRGDLQIFVEQHRQVAGTHPHLTGHQGNGELFPDVGGDILLGLADDLILILHHIGVFNLAAGGLNGFP